MKKTTKQQKTIIFVLAVMLIFGVPFAMVYAKYAERKNAKSVTSANGFYFSSNYLSEVVNNGEYSEYIMYGWDGMTKKSFAFNIRNYDNPLLYNGEGQDVTYDISYEIDDKYAAQVDVVLYKYENGQYHEENLNGSLPGGKENYSYNDYKLSVIPKENANIEEDLSVIITAKTVDSPYDKTLTTKVTLQYTEYQNFISQKEFVNLDDDDYAFEYSICTANAADLEEMENSYVKSATRRLHVWWNTAYVTLDRFDDRNAGAFEIKYIGEDGITADNMHEWTNVILFDRDSGIAHLYFDALPFSAFDIYLYKKLGIQSDVWATLAQTDIVDTEVIRY